MPAASPRLLIIGYVWPEPRSSAAGSRMMQLIHQFLAKGYQITFASPAKPGDCRADLTALGIEQWQIEINDGRFDTLATQLAPNLVIFDRYMMEEQFGWRIAKHCPNAIRILNTEDFHALRACRHQVIKDFDRAPSSSPMLCPPDLTDDNRLFQMLANDELAKREVASIFRSDLTLMISRFELALLEQKFQVPDSHLIHLPFDYPQAQLPKPETLPSFRERKDFIFIGNFRHAPNWDAVLQLKRLWPALHQQLPEAKIRIYGAYPPKKAQQLHNEKQGFLILGWAKEAFEVLSSARICLAPIRFGAGIKGKLAEAMVCGTPSVTTPIGAESMMSEEASWPGDIADTDQAFIDAAVHLYQDESHWLASQTSGFGLFQRQYSEQTRNFEPLFDRIKRIGDDLPAHRRHNFIGAMLNHHHHKSTQYMAQWIEEKNKRWKPEREAPEK